MHTYDYISLFGVGVDEYSKCMLKDPILETALYVTFSLYYCYYLEYPDKAKWLYCFLQGLFWSSLTEQQKTVTYLSIA